MEEKHQRKTSDGLGRWQVGYVSTTGLVVKRDRVSWDSSSTAPSAGQGSNCSALQCTGVARLKSCVQLWVLGTRLSNY